MSNKKFVYGVNLPVSGLTLPNGSEVILNPGKEISLSEELERSPNIQTLIENGHLVPVVTELGRSVESVKEEEEVIDG